MSATERLVVGALAAVAIASVGLAGLSARAEPVAEGRPTHVSLGGAGALSGDGRLPHPPITIAWKTHVATSLHGAALVRPGEPIVVADAKGGVLYSVGPGGQILQHVPVSNQGFVGDPLQLTDGTVVVVTSSGDVVGYRREQPRFRVALGPTVHGTPLGLALDDGGFVLGIDAELMAFDGTGGLRGRATLSDHLIGNLSSLDGQIAAVTSTGMVVLWRPGGEVRAAGELGGAVPGLVGGGRTVTSIREDARIVDLDVVTHQVRTREEARGTAVFLGAPFASHATGATADTFSVVELDGTRLSLLTYPRSPAAPGASDPRRTRLATLPGLAADAGGAPPAPVPFFTRSGHSGTGGAASGSLSALLSAPDVEIVTDPSGAFAFAVSGSAVGAGGIVGIADPASASVTNLDRTVCTGVTGPAPRGSATGRGEPGRGEVAGLAIGAGTLVVTCAGGDVVALVAAGPARSPAP
jgi:hypothetical protein